MKNLLTIFLLIVFFSNSKAQEIDSNYKYWMTYGFMVYERTVTGNLSYSFSLGENFYKVGYIGRGGFMGGLTDGGYTHKSVAISVGKRTQSDWFQGALFIGPSYVFGERKTFAGNHENYKTIGLQSDLQLLFRLADEVGFGVGLFGNINFVRSFSGVNINITLGNGK